MKQFFDVVRADLFGGRMTADQVEGCEAILRASRLMPLTHRAYLLATAYHETARSMMPVKETVMPHHRDKNPSDAEVIRRLEAAWARGRLPQVKTPYWRDGWFGRGYVQLTWRNNYDRAGRALGLDLIGRPELAMVPEHAAAILARGCAEGWFTGRKMADYASYRDMRRVVNGLDCADEIAGHAAAFERALRAVPPIAAPPPAGDPVETTAPPSGGFFMRLLRALFGRT